MTVVSNDKLHRRPHFRLAMFLGCSVLIFLALNTLYSFTGRLNRLDAVEAERDQWQRPGDVLRALDLRPGDTVVDLGSGAGYFALKLSQAVGERGRVLAVDLRRLSLFFLWTRALLQGQHNVHVIAGEDNYTHLPTGTVDGMLICNSYHEFTNLEVMLNHILGSLRPGGHLVIVDRGLPATNSEHPHEMPITVVERELRKKGFEIINREDRFIDRSSDDLWWLLDARKP